MPALDAEALSDFGEFFHLVSRLDNFILAEQKRLLFGLKLVTAVLRQLLNDITKFRTTFVTGTGCLPLASATGSLGVFASTTDKSVLFILMGSF